MRWKAETLYFSEKNFGQHLVNSCWPIFLFVVLQTLFLTYFNTIFVHCILVNPCWPSVDQNYFFEKYVSRAFKCRVDDNFLMSGYENSIWWSYSIFGHFWWFFGIFHKKTKMTENVITSSDWIFMTRHRKIIIDTAFESPGYILFKKIILVNTWSTSVDLTYLENCIETTQNTIYSDFGYYFSQHLLTKCWPNFFIVKRCVSAFKCRVGWPRAISHCENI